MLVRDEAVYVNTDCSKSIEYAGEKFRENDIVIITYVFNNSEREVIGRLVQIGNEQIYVDTSERFHSYHAVFDYYTIIAIRRYDERDYFKTETLNEKYS